MSDAAVIEARPLWPRALYQDVAERLRQQIFARELEPGSWIDELKIAEEFGISRTPLREALKVLAAEGLVTMKVRRGAYVTEVSERDLADVGVVETERRVAVGVDGQHAGGRAGRDGDFTRADSGRRPQSLHPHVAGKALEHPGEVVRGRYLVGNAHDDVLGAGRPGEQRSQCEKEREDAGRWHGNSSGRREAAADAVAETERVVSTESDMRKSILAGMDPEKAYLKYGKF